MTPTPFVHTPVVSSVLSSIAYSDSTLELQFRSGALYRYFTVPPAIFQALFTAPSKGTYFNRYVRNSFPHQQVA